MIKKLLFILLLSFPFFASAETSEPISPNSKSVYYLQMAANTSGDSFVTWITKQEEAYLIEGSVYNHDNRLWQQLPSLTIATDIDLENKPHFSIDETSGHAILLLNSKSAEITVQLSATDLSIAIIDVTYAPVPDFPPPLPVSGLSAFLKWNERNEGYWTLRWNPSPSEHISHYKVMDRSTKAHRANVPANENEYHDPNKGGSRNYLVIAVDTFGRESDPVQISVKFPY